jgi:ubiquinone/menaquinone biosynthesis C-methylase UbiE
VTLARWYLGLLGLAMLREYPFGDPELAERRAQAMRDLLEGRGDAQTFELREYDVLEPPEAYDAWADRYDEPNPLIVAEERALSTHLDGIPPGLALDAATGTGRVASRLRALGHRVIACDRSAAMLRRASEKLGGGPVVRSTVVPLPVRSASIDLVTCSLALTHVNDLVPVLSEFARVLRPHGVAVISDVHPFAVMTGAHAFFRRADESRAVVRNEEHGFAEYLSAALDAGFTVESCSEARVDRTLLRDFGVPDDPMHPEQAVLGLPFALVLTLRRA